MCRVPALLVRRFRYEAKSRLKAVFPLSSNCTLASWSKCRARSNAVPQNAFACLLDLLFILENNKRHHKVAAGIVGEFESGVAGFINKNKHGRLYLFSLTGCDRELAPAPVCV